MQTKRQIVSGVLVCFTLSLSSLSFAEDKSQSTTPMSSELRKDMADMYQKMAVCLRTDTSLSLEECQRKVANDCPVVAKTGQCPIEKGIGHRGSRGMRSEGMGLMGGPHKMR
ncbi:MAG: hypothetical protein NPIRA04_03550 [Nitrospirales bacterium]|nr:MAG: hypothetical protein NPIRA04_03550 [Nitrospirales bacterium]